MAKVRAAGIMYLSGDAVLLLKRQRDASQPGTWAFPGGKVEEGETTRQAAIRESKEEISYVPENALSQIDYSASDYIEFTTYLCKVNKFKPELNDEHTGYVWAALDDLPSPMHPGSAATIEKFRNTRFAMDSARLADGNGWYEIKGNPISKVGVFPYMGRSIGADDPDKIYYVYRPAEELSDPEAIASFKLLPWIDDHVMLGTKVGRIPAEEKGVAGVIGEDVYFDADSQTLRGNIKIFSENLAQTIEAGKRQLSAGYRCMYEMATGVWNGQKYDAIQRHIRGNHLALVQNGRMGPDVAVLDSLQFTIDSKELIMDDEAKKVKEAADAAAALQATKDADEKEAKEKAAMAAADKAAKDEDEAKEKSNKEATDSSEKLAAMDSQIKSLTGEITDLKKNAFKSVMAEAAARNTLADKLSTHIGTFDHSEMSLNEVASYGVEKLGIKCTKGHEQAALDGYLIGRNPTPTSFALDSGELRTGSKIAALIKTK